MRASRAAAGGLIALGACALACANVLGIADYEPADCVRDCGARDAGPDGDPADTAAETATDSGSDTVIANDGAPPG